VPDEVEDVCEVLWRYRRMWPQLFNLYACFGNMLGTDLTSLTLNQWTQLFVEAGFISTSRSNKCTVSDCDRLFTEVNARSAAMERDGGSTLSLQPAKNSGVGSLKRPPTKQQVDADTPTVPSDGQSGVNGVRPGADDDEMKVSKSKAKLISAKSFKLAVSEGAPSGTKGGGGGGSGSSASRTIDRIEFLYALVKVAITKYIFSGAMRDVSDGLERLLSVDARAALGPALTPPDDFRRQVCYTEAVTEVLFSRQSSLKAAFSGLAASTPGCPPTLLSMPCWLGFLRGLGNMIGPDLTLRDAVLCFSWSRMAVIDELTVRGRLKATHLPLEGFYEGFTRMAMLKSLPTTEEIAAAGCSDAGDFILTMQEADPDRYLAFTKCETNRAEWGSQEIAGGEPAEVRLSHLLALVIGTMEAQIGRQRHERDGSLSEFEIKKWCQERLKIK
jgi:hypothetical protein